MNRTACDRSFGFCFKSGMTMFRAILTMFNVVMDRL